MNASIPFALAIVLAFCSGVTAAVIAGLLGRWTTLSAVRRTNENAREIARQNNEHALRAEWIKARRTMIEKLAVEFFETARVSVLRVHILRSIADAETRNDQSRAEDYRKELSAYPGLGQLVQQLQHAMAVARLLKLPSSKAIEKHNNILLDLLTVAVPVGQSTMTLKMGERKQLETEIIESLANAIA